jgi:hypothetical protein
MIPVNFVRRHNVSQCYWRECQSVLLEGMSVSVIGGNVSQCCWRECQPVVLTGMMTVMFFVGMMSVIMCRHVVRGHDTCQCRWRESQSVVLAGIMTVSVIGGNVSQ